MLGSYINQCLRSLGRRPGIPSLQAWTVSAVPRQLASNVSARAYSTTADHYEAGQDTYPQNQQLPVMTGYSAYDLNSVSLIGTLGVQPELKRFPSGTRNARLSIAINSKTDKAPAEWVDVVVWDELAEACSSLTKGKRICVKGTYKVESWMDKVTQQMRKKSVVVASVVYLLDPQARYQEIDDYVYYDVPDTPQDEAFAQQPPYMQQDVQVDSSFQSFSPATVDDAPASSMPPEEPPQQIGWTDLARNPADFWDNRESKWSRNPKGPDYVHKKHKTALWLNSAPAWILDDKRFTPVLQKPNPEN